MTTGGPGGAPRVVALVAQPRPTGLVIQLLDLLSAVAAHGGDPHVTFLLRRGSDDRELREAAERRGLTCAVLWEAGALDPAPVRAFLDQVVRLDPDIVQTHGYKPSLFGLLARVMTGIPWVAFYHGRTTTDRKVRVYHTIDRWLMSLASGIVTVAEGVEGHFNPWDRRRLFIVSNGVVDDKLSSLSRSDARRKLGLPAGGTVIGCVGRLSEEKGPDLFLEACGRLIAEVDELVPVLAGDGPMKPALLSLATRLGLDPHVRFLGHVDAIGDVYRAVDVLVIPSRSEVFPNVLLEGVLAGVPVAATPVGGIPGIAEGLPTVVLAREVGPEAIAAAIRRALNSDEGLLRESCGAVRTRYSQSARLSALLDVYTSVGAFSNDRP